MTGGGTTTYTYDPNGSLLRRVGPGGDDRYAYDARGRLVGLSADRLEGGDWVHIDEAYRYNDRGTRTRRETARGVAAPEVTWFVADERSPYGYSRVVEERATPGGVAVGSFVHGPVPVSVARAGGGAAFYLSDAHSGVRGLAGGGGAVTDAYLFDAGGNLLERTGATDNPLLYRGEQWDPVLGQYHLRARQYDPATGRFTATDPVVGVPGNPATFHDYAYAWNDPVQVTDPSGMLGLAGGALAVALGSFGLSAGYYNSAKQPTGMHIANVVRQSMAINFLVTSIEEYHAVGHNMKKAAKYQKILVRNLYKNAPKLNQDLKKKISYAFSVLGGQAFNAAVEHIWESKDGKTIHNVVVPIKLSGFPDFSSFLYQGQGVTKRQSAQFIHLLGTRGKDFTASNALIRRLHPGFVQPKLPEGQDPGFTRGTVWHHHEVVGIMMLVERRSHPSWHGVPHIGGGAYWDICFNKTNYGDA